jgi:hypothetical protein
LGRRELPISMAVLTSSGYEDAGADKPIVLCGTNKTS